MSAAPKAVALGARDTGKALQKALGNRNFVYKAESKRVVEVLQDFAASRGVPAVVADGVEGVVNASFDVKPEAFLDTMARTYNLMWYFDGTALFFYPGRAMQSRMIRLKGFSREQVSRLLRSLEVGDQRYPIRYDAAQATLFVAGPPRHVELVTAAVETLEQGVKLNAEPIAKVISLRFASASDRTVGGVLVPGLVHTLRGIYAASTEAGPSASTKRLVETMRSSEGGEGASESTSRARPLIPAPKRAGDRSADKVEVPAESNRTKQDAVATEPKAPTFIAHEALNAVVVYAPADKMSEYVALIEQLDQQPRLVELQATIIDVASDSVSALGIEWGYQGGRLSASIQGPSTSPVPEGFTLRTLVADAGRSLLSNVNALQREGKARVVARPSVLGVLNRTAVMRERRVASARVASQYEANLFAIEAGTLIEMTPQLVGGASPRLKLALFIEDGNFEIERVDQIPIVKKTEIRTEAHVLEGHSLLIGGITIERDNNSEGGIPGLRSLPIAGGLFSTSDRRTSRTERMFLITPRLINDKPIHTAAQDSAVLVPPVDSRAEATTAGQGRRVTSSAVPGMEQ